MKKDFDGVQTPSPDPPRRCRRSVVVAFTFAALLGPTIIRAEVPGRSPEDVALWIRAGGLGDRQVLDLAGRRFGADIVQALASCPEVAQLREVDLSGNALGPTGARALVQSAILRHVERLRLASNELGDDGAAALAASGDVARLVELDLSHNGIGPAGLRALAGSPALTALVSLDLAGNGVGPRGAEALATAALARRLRRLGLAGNGLRSEGAAALARAPLDALEALDLGGSNDGGAEGSNALGPDGLAAIARSATMLRLTELRLGHDELTTRRASWVPHRGCSLLEFSDPRAPDPCLSKGSQCHDVSGLEALARSRLLGQLEVLRIQEAGLLPADLVLLMAHIGRSRLRVLDLSTRGPETRLDVAAAALFATWPPGRLEVLDLCGTSPNDEALELLARSPALATVRELRLCGSGITVRGVQALAASPHSGSLRELDLTGHWLKAGDVAPFVAGSRLGDHLRVLRVDVHAANRRAWDPLRARGIELGEEVLEPSVSCGRDGVQLPPGLEQLREVDVEHIHCPAAVIEDLAARPFERLDRLGLCVLEPVVTTLAPMLRRLTRLELNASCGSPVEAPVLRQVLRGLSGPGLTRLATCIDDRGAAVLAAAPELARLVELTVAPECGLGPDGAASLAGSPHLSKLRSLVVSGNPIGARGLRALTRGFPGLWHLGVNDIGDERAIARAIGRGQGLLDLRSLSADSAVAVAASRAPRIRRLERVSTYPGYGDPMTGAAVYEVYRRLAARGGPIPKIEGDDCSNM